MAGRANSVNGDISSSAGITSTSQLSGFLQSTNINSGIGKSDTAYLRGDMTWTVPPAVGTANAAFGVGGNLVYYSAAGTGQELNTYKPTAPSVVVVDENSNVSLASASASGSVLIGSSTGKPAFAQITSGVHLQVSSSGTDVTITASARLNPNLITSSASAVQMQYENSYIINTSALTTLILPTSAAAGTLLKIVGIGTGNWIITQNAGQYIRISSSSVSTTGTGGSVQSAAATDSITLVCMIANTAWIALTAPNSSGLIVT